MRKIFLLIIALLCVLVFLTASHGQGIVWQTKSEVPSDFMVGSARLPAGTYIFQLHNPAHRLYVINTATNERIAVFVREIDRQSAPPADKLVFARDGDRTVLHQVWFAQLEHGRDVVHGAEIKDIK